jgi:hypothetical protein
LTDRRVAGGGVSMPLVKAEQAGVKTQKYTTPQSGRSAGFATAAFTGNVANPRAVTGIALSSVER